MAKALWAIVLLSAAPVFAQSAVDGGTPPAEPGSESAATTAQATPPPETAANQAEVRREVEAQVEKIKKELHEELRAQLATQSAAEGWNQEWTGEKRKLELFVPSGYFRLRPEMFHKLRLGWAQPDPAGYFPYPTYRNENTLAGANMRFRFEPTLNVSEEVRIQAQVDALDNVVLGSTPAYRSDSYYEFGVLNDNQTPSKSAVNSVIDSIMVKRLWGEVSTPVGILRFGRMGSQWGLGILHNDGNCLDCDFGDTVDRIMFVAEPLPGYFVAPAIDFNEEGPVTSRSPGVGQPVDLYNQDDAHSLVLVLARRDTEQQIKSKLENNLSVFNYGVHFEYRTQRFESVTNAPNTNDVGDAGRTTDPGVTTVKRNASLYIPDLWARFERRHMRIELELAGTFGHLSIPDANPVTGRTDDQLNLVQYGGALQGEYRFLSDKLKVGGELGFASGDRAPGFGFYAGRTSVNPNPAGTSVGTQPGSLDGPQYTCQTAGGCTDHYIRNFRFNRDYRVDEILFREIIGGVTDAVYVKPTLGYTVADGLQVIASAIYSRAVYASSTPSQKDNSLGLELDLGARYQTEDGFFAGLTYAVLFPFSGLNPSNNPTQTSLDTAQALRGVLGIKF